MDSLASESRVSILYVASRLCVASRKLPSSHLCRYTLQGDIYGEALEQCGEPLSV